MWLKNCNNIIILYSQNLINLYFQTIFCCYVYYLFYFQIKANITGLKWWNRICLVSSSLRWKEVGHSAQTKVRSVMCTRSWRDSLSLRLKAKEQMRQAYGFAPVWITACRTRSPREENIFSQCSQEWGRRPEWTRACLFKFVLRVNVLPQTGHLNGRAPSGEYR